MRKNSFTINSLHNTEPAEKILMLCFSPSKQKWCDDQLYLPS